MRAAFAPARALSGAPMVRGHGRKHAARERLARRVRVLRAMHGWSQETLAELAGLHRTYISNIEHARCGIRLETLDKLARAFNTTAAALLE